jgi:hypothetical protein
MMQGLDADAATPGNDGMRSGSKSSHPSEWGARAEWPKSDRPPQLRCARADKVAVTGQGWGT